MKHILLPCLLIALLAGCTKEKPVDPSEPTPPVDTTTHIIELGKGSVSRNGTPWDAVFSAHLNTVDKNRFSLIARLNEDGFDHKLSISDVSILPGLQFIENKGLGNGNNGIPNARYSVWLDMDQQLNSYNVDSTRSNQYIELLRYDSINHIVEGRFQTFLEGPNTWWFLPDSMAITEGKFHLKIQ
jgi:hypothetical protein